MVEGAPINIVEQGRLETILMCNMDKLTKYTPFMDAMTPRAIVNKSFTMQTAAFVKKNVE